MSSTPLITLLFPLYKSKQFLNNLMKHFDQYTSNRISIIVSDRHGFDDTLEVLREKYGSDSRFTFYSATDGIGWVDHYNFLIDKVTGKYFSFVPHDDNYPPEYFETLAEELENKPSAVIAFSHMTVTGDRDWVIDHSVFSTSERYPFSSAQYMKFLYSNRIGVAFRGLFRTSTVRDQQLHIKQNERVKQYQDYYWIFALLERGDFIYTEKTSCTKNFRNEGASGRWDYAQFFKTNKAARNIIYEYTFSSPLPISTKLSIYSGIELRRIKARVGRMIKGRGKKKAVE